MKPFPVAPLPPGWRLKKPADVRKALEKAADAARTRVSAYSPKRRAKLSKAAQEA